ncbi:uncharacterized protein LOC126559130 [Anopheles maculipalpis]|uniref:uncharacterized protein LOC126559130 n=1 Tax=Anopheles maculipalpis TaxID=1496333 RepID=UPI002159240B|nr:uncharacterized protein LOC126559130 [Anopheles maculipalpis]
MKMKMPDNNIGGSSSNTYTHITINAGMLNRAGVGAGGGGGGDADTTAVRNTTAGIHYPHDPYDSDAESLSTPPNEGTTTGAADDFAEYMWMENEDEFDMQELQRLEEEELMDQCIEAMMMDEMASAELMASAALVGNVPRESGLVNILSSLQLDKDQQQLIRQPKDVNVEKSTLNPLAAEFVPSFGQRALVAPTSY